MKLLDLYCGEGLGAWGYWLSGRFGEIVGVDNDPEMSTRYAFDFMKADALRLTYEFLDQFDFIHASPPCQAYSKSTPDRSKHPRLIAATHLMLIASGKPYVIENVEGSSRELKPNLVMNGHYVGIPSERRRYFHVSTLEAPVRLMRTGAAIHVNGSGYTTREKLIEAMGLSAINERRLAAITMRGMEQGIAPAMTKWIAEKVIKEKEMVG